MQIRETRPFSVLLTHANRADDRRMADLIQNWPRTIILGGHDHHLRDEEWGKGPSIYKNLANLQTIGVHMLMAGGDMPMEQLLARLIHRSYAIERRMQRKSAIRFTFLVAKPVHGSIEERHTRHERIHCTSLRSSIGLPQEDERWVRWRAAFVGRGGSSTARRREEARSG